MDGIGVRPAALDAGEVGRPDVAFVLLWGAAMATYGFGDATTTVVFAVHDLPLEEANPAMRLAIEWLGVAGVFVLKFGSLGAGLVVSAVGHRVGDRGVLRYGPAAVFSVAGIALTVSNVATLLAVA